MKVHKVTEIDSAEVTAESKKGEIITIKRHKVFQGVKKSDWLLYAEHGFYDIVDENGILLTGTGTKSPNSK